jgi:AraC-like DNA-binding protein
VNGIQDANGQESALQHQPSDHPRVPTAKNETKVHRKRTFPGEWKNISEMLIEMPPSTLLLYVRVYRVPRGLAAVTDWPELAFACDYRVGSIARACGVSVGQFRRFCRRRLKCRPKRWLRGLRLAEAEARLAAGQGTKAVARVLQYRDAPHFCREFRRAHGLSPGDWLASGAQARSRTVVRLPRAPKPKRKGRDLDFPWLIPADLLEVLRQWFHREDSAEAVRRRWLSGEVKFAS